MCNRGRGAIFVHGGGCAPMYPSYPAFQHHSFPAALPPWGSPAGFTPGVPGGGWTPEYSGFPPSSVFPAVPEFSGMGGQAGVFVVPPPEPLVRNELGVKKVSARALGTETPGFHDFAIQLDLPAGKDVSIAYMGETTRYVLFPHSNCAQLMTTRDSGSPSWIDVNRLSGAWKGGELIAIYPGEEKANGMRTYTVMFRSAYTDCRGVALPGGTLFDKSLSIRVSGEGSGDSGTWHVPIRGESLGFSEEPEPAREKPAGVENKGENAAPKKAAPPDDQPRRVAPPVAKLPKQDERRVEAPAGPVLPKKQDTPPAAGGVKAAQVPAPGVKLPSAKAPPVVRTVPEGELPEFLQRLCLSAQPVGWSSEIKVEGYDAFANRVLSLLRAGESMSFSQGPNGTHTITVAKPTDGTLAMTTRWRLENGETGQDAILLRKKENGWFAQFASRPAGGDSLTPMAESAFQPLFRAAEGLARKLDPAATTTLQFRFRHLLRGMYLARTEGPGTELPAAQVTQLETVIANAEKVKDPALNMPATNTGLTLGVGAADHDYELPIVERDFVVVDLTIKRLGFVFAKAQQIFMRNPATGKWHTWYLDEGGITRPRSDEPAGPGARAGARAPEPALLVRKDPVSELRTEADPNWFFTMTGARLATCQALGVADSPQRKAAMGANRPAFEPLPKNAGGEKSNVDVYKYVDELAAKLRKRPDFAFGKRFKCTVGDHTFRVWQEDENFLVLHLTIDRSDQSRDFSRMVFRRDTPQSEWQMMFLEGRNANGVLSPLASVTNPGRTRNGQGPEDSFWMQTHRRLVMTWIGELAPD